MRKIPDALASIRHYCLSSKGHGLKTHGISYYSLRSWSHAFKAAIGQILENNFCQSVQNPVEKEKKKKKDNCKALRGDFNMDMGK